MNEVYPVDSLHSHSSNSGLIVDLLKVGVAGRGSSIGCGHRHLEPTINEMPSYHLYVSNRISGVKNKTIYLKKLI